MLTNTPTFMPMARYTATTTSTATIMPIRMTLFRLLRMRMPTAMQMAANTRMIMCIVANISTITLVRIITMSTRFRVISTTEPVQPGHTHQA